MKQSREAIKFMRQEVRTRLAKLLGMLGSAHDGEILSATQAIRRVLESEKLSFADLVDAFNIPPWEGPSNWVNQSKPQPQAASKPEYKQPASWIVEYGTSILSQRAKLQPHELRFVEDMIAQARIRAFTPSEKQARWFSYLHSRYGRRAA
jgi:hypothetical protein